MPAPDMTELQVRRKELDLTQGQVADAAGVDISEISKWERLISEPRNLDRQRYAAALGWSVEHLGAVIYRSTAAAQPALPLAEA
jgi:transcriptional regulator with XRE-family HTH domain